MVSEDRVFVIAEAGVNHNGSLDLAKRLVEEAARAGADCVKFQTFDTNRLVSHNAEKAAYQKRNTEGAATQYEMLSSLELSEADHRALLSHCRRHNIVFLSSPFDEKSADMLETLGVAAFKIPSGELTNTAFLRHLALKNKPLILSSGMSTLGEVAEAVEQIVATGNRQLFLLHCVTEYPAPVEEINLRAMCTLAGAFGFPVGYSDHTPGNEIAIAAVALGARIIEKHFTLSREMAGPDHSASLEPKELAEMIRAIRSVESALGNGTKAPAPCEARNKPIARKSVVATTPIKAGEAIGPQNASIKRPGYGIEPKDFEKIVGLRVTRDIEADSVITWDDLK